MEHWLLKWFGSSGPLVPPLETAEWEDAPSEIPDLLNTLLGPEETDLGLRPHPTTHARVTRKGGPAGAGLVGWDVGGSRRSRAVGSPVVCGYLIQDRVS